MSKIIFTDFDLFILYEGIIFQTVFAILSCHIPQGHPTWQMPWGSQLLKKQIKSNKKSALRDDTFTQSKLSASEYKECIMIKMILQKLYS